MLWGKISLPFLAFLQATALVVYIGFVSLFFVYGEGWFGRIDNLLGPILLLLLFIISAVISASLFLGKAGILFWEKKYRESFTLLFWTTAWSLFYLVGLVLILVLVK